MVRVAGLKGMVNAAVADHERRRADAGRAARARRCGGGRARSPISRRCGTCSTARCARRASAVIEADELTDADREWLSNQFREQIFPVLTPLAIDPAHPFPFIPNLGFTLALKLLRARDGKTVMALLPVPPQLQRFVRLPGTDNKRVRFLPLEDRHRPLSRQALPRPYRASAAACSASCATATWKSRKRPKISCGCSRRCSSAAAAATVIHMKCSKSMPDDLREFIVDHLGLEFRRGRPHRAHAGPVGHAQAHHRRARRSAVQALQRALPRAHPRSRRRLLRGDPRQGHHRPSSLRELRRRWCSSCARPRADPDVVAIKQTLYRTVSDSPIVSALIEAAEAGKSVTALVELKARFDEEANIQWARDLERAGVQVVYGFIELKTHAKVSLVVRRESGSLRTYVHFGTGNYHPHDREGLHRPVALHRRSGAGPRCGAALQLHHRLCRARGAGEDRDLAARRLRGKLIDCIQEEIDPCARRQAGRDLGQAQLAGRSGHDRRALCREPGGRADRSGGARHLLPACRACRACRTISASRASSAASWSMAASSASATATACRRPRPRSSFLRPTGCRAISTAASKRWCRSRTRRCISRCWTRSWWRCSRTRRRAG